MSDSINAEFEAYVEAELGDIAVVSEGRFISPKIQNYFKIWQHLQAEVEALRKDAERYQWLRRMGVGLSLSHQVISQFVTNQGELDAVIANDTQDEA